MDLMMKTSLQPQPQLAWTSDISFVINPLITSQSVSQSCEVASNVATRHPPGLSVLIPPSLAALSSPLREG